MCQGKHSATAIDIPVSCKVTEDRFQMKPASLKRHNYLDTENRKKQSCFQFHTVLQLILNGSHEATDESVDEKKKRRRFKVLHTISLKELVQHQYTQCLIIPGCHSNNGVSRSRIHVVLQFSDASHLCCAHTHTLTPRQHLSNIKQDFPHYLDLA